MMKTSKLNKLILLIIVVCALFYLITPIKKGDIYNILIVITIIPVAILPFIIEKLSKVKIPNMLLSIYMIFILFAYFFGSIVGLYNKIAWYDTVAHFTSGIVVAFALFYLYKIINKDSKSKLILILFIIGVSSLIGVSWEIFEFVSDNIFGKDAQHVLDTGVTDTMIDMIVALLGSIVFVTLYLIENKLNIKGIITKYNIQIEGTFK